MVYAAQEPQQSAHAPTPTHSNAATAGPARGGRAAVESARAEVGRGASLSRLLARLASVVRSRTAYFVAVTDKSTVVSILHLSIFHSMAAHCSA